jgi:hypothetical protein
MFRIGVAVGRAQIHTLMSFHPQRQTLPADVPDPYYDGDAAFEHVYSLIEASMPNLFQAILKSAGEGDDSKAATGAAAAASSAASPAVVAKSKK